MPAVLGADTVVACGRRILPKPADAAEARACLGCSSGRGALSSTAAFVVVLGVAPICAHVMTRVMVKRLSQAEIAAYLASGEWQGKAGGYAIQGLAAAFVASINGSYSNVVGLPLFETVGLLHGLGIAP